VIKYLELELPDGVKRNLSYAASEPEELARRINVALGVRSLDE
jgi:hypothetical protein